MKNFCKIQKGSSAAKEKKNCCTNAKLLYRTLPTPQQKILSYANLIFSSIALPT
jgi:hypothetical protein